MGHTASQIDYEIDGQSYEGYFAKPDTNADAPLVVVAHAWGGLKENEISKAQIVADQLGYAAFAIDVYGKGKRGDTPEECQALMNPMAGNRAELQKRLSGGLAAARQQTGIDKSKVAAIGYCFGGLCVLDMARANMEVCGVAAFHGLFMPADNLTVEAIKPKVLIEHGWNDPMATPQDVLAIAAEMQAAKADWQIHGHGGTYHSFTTEGVNSPEMGSVYDAKADARSFAYLSTFLEECFA